MQRLLERMRRGDCRQNGHTSPVFTCRDYSILKGLIFALNMQQTMSQTTRTYGITIIFILMAILIKVELLDTTWAQIQKISLWNFIIYSRKKKVKFLFLMTERNTIFQGP